jgi:hypothetical protein
MPPGLVQHTFCKSLALPIWAEFVQSRLTTTDWLTQITDMARELETAATT